jgi:hypothetical protein
MEISLHVSQVTVLLDKYYLFPAAVNFLAYGSLSKYTHFFLLVVWQTSGCHQGHPRKLFLLVEGQVLSNMHGRF